MRIVGLMIMGVVLLGSCGQEMRPAAPPDDTTEGEGGKGGSRNGGKGGARAGGTTGAKGGAGGAAAGGSRTGGDVGGMGGMGGMDAAAPDAPDQPDVAGDDA